MLHECLLIALNQDHWVKSLQGNYNNGRLSLYPQQTQYSNAVTALQDPILIHNRYDSVLIYVDQNTISAWRTALSIAHNNTPPIVIYAANLKSQALHDFLHLGAADFISPPFNSEELRTRLENIGNKRPINHIAEDITTYDTKPISPKTKQPTKAVVTTDTMCDSILDYSGAELEAFAISMASQQATSKESFRSAKSRIISRFEKAYIRASLMQHNGNVTLAAQAAQKHRRAFWALMKKHNISPNAYRN